MSVDLTRVITTGSGTDGVAPLTDWESINPALGSGSRPSPARTWDRNASTIQKVNFCCSHRVKYQYTVSHGGKSTGSCRQAHPVRTTYKIASTMSRRGCFSGRPPRVWLVRAGSNGSTTGHSASVRSDG